MGNSEVGSTVAHGLKQYGVTKPISLAGPTEADLQRTVELEKVCSSKFSPFFLLFACFFLLFLSFFTFSSLYEIVPMKFLVEAGLYERKDEAARREEVLGQLDLVIAIIQFACLILMFYSIYVVTYSHELWACFYISFCIMSYVSSVEFI